MLHRACAGAAARAGSDCPVPGSPEAARVDVPEPLSPPASLLPSRRASALKPSEITPGGVLARQLQSGERVSIQSATDMIQLEKPQDTRAPTRLNTNTNPRANPRMDEFERFLRHARSHEASGERLSPQPWLHLAEAWRISQALQDC